MSGSHIRVLVHIVFSTKGRHPWLADAEFRNRLFSYIAQTCEEMGWLPVIVGGHVDHVHVLCRLEPQGALASLVRDLKRSSSRWAKEQGVPVFAWQEGYEAFSVSDTHLDVLVEYIRNQDRHHESRSYAEEVRRLADPCQRTALPR